MADSRRSAEPPDRSHGVFLGDLAHDLSTPLTAIHGATELLLAGTYGPLRDEQRALIAEILASARELRAYAQDIADLGALDTGRLAFASTAFELAAVVDELRSTLTDLSARRSVAFALESRVASPTLVSDQRRLRQILFSLFGYLVKASKRGNEVSGLLSLGDGTLLAEARATGVATDPSTLFADRRERAPGAPKPYSGPGLGLPLVHRIVEAWGGRTSAEASDGVLVLRLEVPADLPPE